LSTIGKELGKRLGRRAIRTSIELESPSTTIRARLITVHQGVEIRVIANQLTRVGSIALATAIGTTGCVNVAVAPGAEQVKIAKGAGDVASCKAVGNVISKPMGISATNTDLQNKTFGLGGNTIFVTVTTGEAVEGVAYKCP
jgi:hypothetical protein